MAVVRLWVDKYRPKELNEYVWRDDQMRSKVEEWLKVGYVPHLMLTGPSGTGKTSLARMLMHQMKIPAADVLTINASSSDAHVAQLQRRIEEFSSSYAFGDSEMKYVLLDEADRMSIQSQEFLRGEVEKENNNCRFIFTANNPKKIHPAIHSRCHEIKFKVLDRSEFLCRAGEILTLENIEFSYEDLEAHVNVTYPDLRKCITLLDGNSLLGKLSSPKVGDDGTADYLIDLVEMFKSKRYNDARRVLIASAQVDEYPAIFRYFYENLSLFGATEELQNRAVLIIRKGLVHHANIADPEINMSATLIELTQSLS